MRYLLDTHVFLWHTIDSRQLRAPARKLIEGATAVFVSSASIWELAIKAGLGKVEADPELLIAAIEASGFVELPVSARHGARVAALPHLHKDPFDRLLVAQALCEPLILLTHDDTLKGYGGFVQTI